MQEHVSQETNRFVQKLVAVQGNKTIITSVKETALCIIFINF